MARNDDILKRSEVFEKKLEQAGSTEGIIAGLVKGLERNERIIFWLAISLILDFVLSIVLGAVSVWSWKNTGDIQNNTENISKLTFKTCSSSSANTIVINDFIDILIKGYTNAPPSQVPPAEAKREIAKYKALKAEVLKC